MSIFLLAFATGLCIYLNLLLSPFTWVATAVFSREEMMNPCWYVISWQASMPFEIRAYLPDCPRDSLFPFVAKCDKFRCALVYHILWLICWSSLIGYIILSALDYTSHSRILAILHRMGLLASKIMMNSDESAPCLFEGSADFLATDPASVDTRYRHWIFTAATIATIYSAHLIAHCFSILRVLHDRLLCSRLSSRNSRRTSVAPNHILTVVCHYYYKKKN